jgi:AAHS family 4-hydroxybenzoate transporter-like MFS transporter
VASPFANVAGIIDGRPIGAFQKLVVLLCTAVVFFEGMTTQAAGYVGPVLRETWRLEPEQLALFFSSALIGLMLGGVFVAPLADRVGRRPVLIGCVALFGLCSLVSAASPSIAILDIARFLTGLGIGGGMPNAIALTAEYAPHRRRNAMVAVMMSGFIFGSIAGGLVSAWLVPEWGWQSVFIASGLLPLALLPVLVATLPESIRFLVLRTNAAAAVARLMNRIAPDAGVDANTRFLVEEHGGSGVSVLALFRDDRARTTVLLWTIYFMSLLNLYLFASWLPTHTHALGISVGLSIIVGTMLQVGGAFGTVFGWLNDRIGHGRTIFAAYLIAAICIAWVGLSGANLPVLILAVFGAGFGIIGGQNSVNALAAVAYPTQIRSTGVGWAIGIGRIGSIIGPGLAGMLLQTGVTTENIFYLAVIPALAASLCGVALGFNRSLAVEKDATA